MANAAMYDPYGGDEAAPMVESRFLDFLRDFELVREGEDAPLKVRSCSSGRWSR